jgi:hypothetical protein
VSETSAVINRAKSTEPGTPYAALRAQAIAHVQKMSGQIWTDYNFSDPGVTTIEQLCYALTELPYRAAFPVRDLLCAPGTARVQLRRQGLFPARSILPCNPVTANDLRRLVIDRVAGAANAWFTPVTETARRPGGLYDLTILSPHEHGDDQAQDERLIHRVLRCYTAHRALCEDVRVARILRPRETIVHARVELEDAADPSATLARVFFALGLSLAPEPRRTSLAERDAVDPVSTEIFSGPLMLRGFIADDQLTDLPTVFTADGLAEVLSEATGVLTLADLSVEISGDPRRYRHDEPINVPDGSVLRLHTAARDGRFSITLFRRNVRCDPDVAQVRRKLAELWRQQRKTYPLRAEYADVYGPEKAAFWDLASYVSIQNQFPVTYGVGEGGLPPGADGTRRAQAKQFKGYLMPFDQLLADYFSQLAFVRDLFSVQAGGASTYAYQSLRPIVPDAAPLLSPGYEADLARLTAEFDPVNARRDAILDLLLSFYALQLEATPPSSADPRETARLKAALVQAKQTLLRQAAMATRDRGRGLDYMRRFSARSMAGVEALSRLQLGLLDAEADAPTPVDDPTEANFGRRAPREIWPEIDQRFKPLPDDLGESEDKEAETPRRSLMAGHTVARELLSALSEPDRRRIGVLGAETTTVVLVLSDEAGGWWVIAEVESESAAWREWRALIRHAAQLRERSHRRRLYLVEWILLRHARAPDADAERRFDFRISAVVSAGDEEQESAAWRTQATDILRANTPAHVALDTVFLDPDEMDRFEALYARWTDALRRGPPHRLVDASARLEHFLARRSPHRSSARTYEPATPDIVEATGAAEPRSAPSAKAAPAPKAPPSPAPSPQRTTTAETAPAAAVGFDTDRKLTAKTAAAFVAAGFGFAVRYLSRSAPGKPGDLSPDETQAILGAGLALMAVQHVAPAGWSPTQSLGQQYGLAAAENARAAGLPDGVCIWLDLEGVADGARARDVIAYCDAWCHVVSEAGYRPGLYVGVDCGLNKGQLASIVRCERYWRSGSQTPDVGRYGYSMLQTIDGSLSVDGVPYDLNVIQADQRRRTPVWAVASRHAPPVPAASGPVS